MPPQIFRVKMACSHVTMYVGVDYVQCSIVDLSPQIQGSVSRGHRVRPVSKRVRINLAVRCTVRARALFAGLRS